MRATIIGTVAALVGVAFVCPAAPAADTTLLAGVGSLNQIPGDDAPVITLKGDLATTASTILVAHGGGFHGGGFHGGMAHAGGFHAAGFHGGSFHGGWGHVGTARFVGGRAWGWGSGRPWVGRPWSWGWGWNRGWVGRPWGWGWGWNRPWGRWGWNRPWVAAWRPWGWGWNRPWVGGSWGVVGTSFVSDAWSTSPAVVWSSPSNCTCENFAPAAGWETAPPPTPQGGYRYDGGPSNPVPPPAPLPNSVTPRTPPPPAPMTDAVARRPAKKLEYPAYCETSGKVRTARDPLLVKDTRGQ